MTYTFVMIIVFFKTSATPTYGYIPEYASKLSAPSPAKVFQR